MPGCQSTPSMRWHCHLKETEETACAQVPCGRTGSICWRMGQAFHAGIGRSMGKSVTKRKNPSESITWVLVLAETEGFEPSMRLYTPYSLSRGAPSATRSRFQSRYYASFLRLSRKTWRLAGEVSGSNPCKHSPLPQHKATPHFQPQTVSSGRARSYLIQQLRQLGGGWGGLVMDPQPVAQDVGLP